MSAVAIAYLSLVILSFVSFGVGVFAAQLYSNAESPRDRGLKAAPQTPPVETELARPPMSRAA